MFILRRITSKSVEINTSLDNDYVLILKERNPQEFEKTSNLLKWDDDDSTKDIYGYITYDVGESIMPLYKQSNYYIMCSDGKTFANISKK